VTAPNDPVALETNGSNAARRQRSTLLRSESILLKSHWVLVIMDQFNRRIIGFGVHAGDADGIALCRMVNSTMSTQGIARYLSSDNDPLFRYHRWQANLRILDMTMITSVPYIPLSHLFVERLIGTIRGEYVDHAHLFDLAFKHLDLLVHFQPGACTGP
jgi:putative transposase